MPPLRSGASSVSGVASSPHNASDSVSDMRHEPGIVHQRRVIEAEAARPVGLQRGLGFEVVGCAREVRLGHAASDR